MAACLLPPVHSELIKSRYKHKASSDQGARQGSSCQTVRETRSKRFRSNSKSSSRESSLKSSQRNEFKGTDPTFNGSSKQEINPKIKKEVEEKLSATKSLSSFNTKISKMAPCSLPLVHSELCKSRYKRKASSDQGARQGIHCQTARETRSKQFRSDGESSLRKNSLKSSQRNEFEGTPSPFNGSSKQEINPKIKKEIEKLSETKSLFICNTKVSKNDAQDIATELKNEKFLRVLSFGHCTLEPNSMKTLSDFFSSDESKPDLIARFELARMSNVSRGDVTAACKLCKNCSTRVLDVSRSRFAGGESLFKVLKDLLKGSQVNQICVNYEKKMTRQMLEEIARIVKDTPVNSLEFVESHVVLSTLEDLSKALGEEKVRHLDLTYSRDLGVKGMKKLCEFTKKHKVESCVLVGCWLNYKEVEELLNLHETMETLDVSLHPKFDELCFSQVGKVVTRTCLKHLIIRSCDLTRDKLISLRESLKGYKQLSHLDVSHNQEMDEDGFEVLGEIVRYCQLDRLTLNGCIFVEEHVRALVSRMGQSKIGHLDMIDVFQAWDAELADVVVSDLMPKVKDVLRLVMYDPGNKFQQMIKEQVKECKKLKVIMRQTEEQDFT